MRKVAVVVGVGSYADPLITGLPFAAQDALEFSRCLREDCGFDEVELLVSGGEREPEHTAVYDALQGLAPRLSSEDLFLLYFAGHGIEAESGAFLLTANSRIRQPELAAVSMSVLQATLGRLECANRVLVLDACRNDPMRGRGDKPNRLTERFSRDVLALAATPVEGVVPSTCVLFSCRLNERAFEWPEVGHGAFTYHLLQGLRGAATDAMGRVTVQGLGRYVESEVPRWARRVGASESQTPWSEQRGSLREIVLLETAKPSGGGVGESLAGPAIDEATTSVKTTARASVAVDGGATTKATEGTEADQVQIAVAGGTPGGCDDVGAGLVDTEFLPPSPPPSLELVSSVGVSAASSDDGLRWVRFDVAWDESWRGPERPTWVDAADNWDAAWVYVKYRVGVGEWRHAGLHKAGHRPPPGVTIDVPADGSGAFVYRDASGYGRFEARDVRLAWQAAADGVAADAGVDVRVFAIEMVFVPRGPYYLGTGGEEASAFRDGSSSEPFHVAGPGAIRCGDSAGQLGWAAGDTAPSGRTAAGFPTGFESFYVMKRQVTQGEYVAFLNTLTQGQYDARSLAVTGTDWSDALLIGSSAGWAVTPETTPGLELSHGDRAMRRADGVRRLAIAGESAGWLVTGLPVVSMNWLRWADAAAYAAWAGLRPMTELEFEKAARGPARPVPNEYAWGGTSVVEAEAIEYGGTPNELVAPVAANTVCWKEHVEPLGPVRGGSFTAPGRTRQDAGASYYGVLDLSGNLWEWVVNVGNARGRAFAGEHGDGTLTPDASADVPTWPESDALGMGYRGGSYAAALERLQVADRRNVAVPGKGRRDPDDGWRGARTAP